MQKMKTNKEKKQTRLLGRVGGWFAGWLSGWVRGWDGMRWGGWLSRWVAGWLGGWVAWLAPLASTYNSKNPWMRHLFGEKPGTPSKIERRQHKHTHTNACWLHFWTRGPNGTFCFAYGTKWDQFRNLAKNQ